MIEIAGRRVGFDEPPYFIADVGSNHDGDLERAKRLIELAAGAGVDAVKFQNFRAETIVSRRGFEELGKIGHQATWEKDVYETYEAASTPFNWTPALWECCKDHGVAYLTTPYDLDLVDQANPYVPAWKIGSGDVTWHELITKVVSKGKPILLALGASTWDEVRRAVSVIWDEDVDAKFALLQCNSDYTGIADPRCLNLGVVLDLARRASYEVGFSDHSPGWLSVCTAVAVGATVIEKHFTDDPSRPGPDHFFALDPTSWKAMIREARIVHASLGDGKVKVEANEIEARIVQRRAIRWRVPLVEGTNVSRNHLVLTRPCPEGALEPYWLDEVVGTKVLRDVEADTLVRLEDLSAA